MDVKSDIQATIPLMTKNDLKIDFVTKNTLKRMRTTDRCDLILERIRDGKILVFEGGLEPIDEASLVERTMMAIDHEKFMGIEICTPESSSVKTSAFKRGEQRVTIVAPSSLEITVRAI
ncbi:MAG TPA: DUF2073 domain-containing protein [Candidatus Hodarchaeales archaeon]|nr:DUF2073 domain-containing protein [Candidatus Hodarchaeales archaeon]